jgi:N-acetylglucosamine kinase-like BadF-type ATPase
MTTSQYWLGIDAGGTGSTCVLVDQQLRELKRASGGAIQASRMSLEEMLDAIAALVQPFLQEVNIAAIDGLAIGISGISHNHLRQQCSQLLSQRWPGWKIWVTNDADTAHTGAFAGGDGILAITGTGSVVWGKHKDQWVRAGGYGYLIGDEGSGMKLGMDGLSAANYAWDGGEPTQLCNLLEQTYHFDHPSKVVKAVYQDKLPPSEIAHLVLEAATGGDPVCDRIVKRQLTLFVEQIRIVSKKFSTPSIQIVLWGGLNKNEYYHLLLCQYVQTLMPHLILCEPIYDACVGAVLIGRQQTEPRSESGS